MAAGDLKKAVLIYGNDELRVKERAAALASAMAPSSEWGLQIIDAWQDGVDGALACIRSAREALCTPPLLGGEQFIWLKNASFFSDTETIKMASNPEIRAELHRLVQLISVGLPDGVRLLISAPGARVERAKKGEPAPPLQALEESGVFEVEKIFLPVSSPFSQPPPPVEEITNAFKAAGLRLHPDALEQLVELSSAEPRQIRSEVEKLITYCWGQKEVHPHHVNEIVTLTAEETFWTWCDAVVEGRTADALVLLRQLRFQGENPVGLLINLVNHARLVVKIRLLSDRRLLNSSGVTTGVAERLLSPVGDRKSPPSAGRIKRILQQSRRCSFAQWRDFFHRICDTYAAFFETGHDHYTMLGDLVLRLEVTQSDGVRMKRG